MESLGDILRRITQQTTLGNTAAAAATFPGSPETTDVCPICQGAGWVSRAVPVDHSDFGQAFPCRCQQSDEPAARIASRCKGRRPSNPQ